MKSKKPIPWLMILNVAVSVIAIAVSISVCLISNAHFYENFANSPSSANFAWLNLLLVYAFWYPLSLLNLIVARTRRVSGKPMWWLHALQLAVLLILPLGFLILIDVFVGLLLAGMVVALYLTEVLLIWMIARLIGWMKQKCTHAV